MSYNKVLFLFIVFDQTILRMKATSLYSSYQKQLDHNNVFLPAPPQIVLKKIQPTNYQDNHKWYIAPTMVDIELKKIIMHIDEGSEQEKMKKIVRSAEDERKKKIQLAMILRKALQLNKIINNSSIDIFLNFSLGSLYRHLGMEKFALFSYQKVIRNLNQHCLKLKYLEIIPTNYFATNHKFYSQITQRFWSHLMRGRSNLSLSAAYSGAMIHEQAKNLSMSAYLDFFKAAHELLIVFIGNLLKFMIKNHYMIRDHSGPHSKKSGRLRVDTQEQPFIEIQFQNYQLCVNTLHQICSKIGKDSSDPKVEMLKSIIADQTKNLLTYTKYDFALQSHQKNDYLTQKMKKMRFLDLTTPKNLDNYSAFDEKNWSTVDMEVDMVYQLTMYIVACLYALSIEAKFTEQTQFGNAANQFERENYGHLERMKNGKMNKGQFSQSQHWLSRALSISNSHLPNTSLFFQIKNMYTSTYATKVDEEIIQQVSQDNEEATVIMGQNPRKNQKNERKSKEKGKISDIEWQLRKSQKQMNHILEKEDSDQQILNILNKKDEDIQMKAMLKNKEKQQNLYKMEEIQKTNKNRKSQQKKKIHEIQRQRNSQTAPTDSIYQSWKFTMSSNKKKFIPPEKPQSDKQYEIKTLKYGNNMIPVVIRQFKTNDLLKQKQNRYQIRQQRDRKYYMRSLDAKDNPKSINKRRNWQKNLDTIKRAYDSDFQQGRKNQKKGKNNFSYEKDSKKHSSDKKYRAGSIHNNNESQILYNRYGKEQNTAVNDINSQDKKRNIGYARYKQKDIRVDKYTGEQWMIL